MSTSWKYVDASRSVVYRVDDEGAMHSMMVISPDIEEWVAAGNTIISEDPPSPAVQLAVKVRAGLNVTSTATPSLDGVYAIDDGVQQTITGIAAGIATRNRLPGGGSSFHYTDAAGTPHTFSSADFLNFAAAVEDYLYALVQTQRTLSAGGSAAWPSPNVTIA